MAEAPSVPPGLTLRRYRVVFLMILAVAGLWRLSLAGSMPCLSRDGAKFCWMAQTLERHGPQALRLAEFDQHPAYPYAILAAKHGLTAIGFANEPLTWQRAGQCVSWLTGLGVIALTGLLTRRLIESLVLPVDGRLAALLAMALATVLDLNAWLSADVMSDQLYLCFFVAGALALISLPRPIAALAAGALAGLAFLTRPEGGVLCIGAAVALVALFLSDIRSNAQAAPGLVRCGLRRSALAVALFGVAFLACAAPYCAWIGGLSPKMNKETIEQFRPTASAHPPLAFARTFREDFSWYGACGRAAYETVRAGRVVVPLIGLLALWRLRPKWPQPALAALLACIAVHFALTVWLAYRHGYLHSRHTLVVVALLTPIAGIALAFFVSRMQVAGKLLLGCVLAGACVLGPVLWALRIPNRQDANVARAAAALLNHDNQLASKRLLTDSSGRRIAFYTGMTFVPWPENEPTDDARFAELRARLAAWDNPPEYFAIETGPGEREGNDRLIARLLADPKLAKRLREVVREPGEKDVVLRVFELGR